MKTKLKWLVVMDTVVSGLTFWATSQTSGNNDDYHCNENPDCDCKCNRYTWSTMTGEFHQTGVDEYQLPVGYFEHHHICRNCLHVQKTTKTHR